MGARAFLDITSDDGGRLYVFDTEGRLRETSSFTLDEDMQPGGLTALPEEVGEVCLSVPLNWLDFRLLPLELKDKLAARQVLPFELEGILSRPASDYVIDAVVDTSEAGAADAGEEGDAPEKTKAIPPGVLAVYMERQRLDVLIKGMDSAGLDPRHITSIELASALKKQTGGELASILLESPELDEPERVDLAIEGMREPVVDMRIGEFAFKGDVHKGIRSIIHTVTLFVSLMLVLSTAFALKAISAGREADVLEEKVLATYVEVFPGPKPASARGLSYKVRSKLKEMRGKVDSMASVETLEFMLKLQEALPKGVKMNEITIDTASALLKGEGPNLEAIEQARAAMEGGLMGEVKITETGKAVSGQTGFTMAAKKKKPETRPRR